MMANRHKNIRIHKPIVSINLLTRVHDDTRGDGGDGGVRDAHDGMEEQTHTAASGWKEITNNQHQIAHKQKIS